MTPPGFELRVFHTRGGFLKHWTSRWSMVIAVKHGKRERERGGGGSEEGRGIVCLLVGCLTSQQQASVSQGRICSDNFTCCHTEIEVAVPTFYLTQS